ncbi:hypothetical protein [Eleftheria terrae]|uniref:hypothetical protein n=1 Tax=Eleftheria terrae TaxID=1597781 RepID=UPI00263B5015|nr:hypothetical protein [Eleftheria terrae]WKB53485.1 hypothetical protein N7L95_03545 [Eleftheria terrae]
MEQDSLEALTVAAMLAVLSCVATVHWRQQRAVSWGALGILLLIPEATSRLPSAALLHLILASTVLVVVAQLAYDARRQPAQLEQPAEAGADLAPSAEYPSRGLRAGDVAGLLGAAAVGSDGRDAASL